MSGPTGPTSDPRPALPPVYNGTSAVISANIGVIVTWLIRVSLDHFQVQTPGEVFGAMNVLAASAIAFAVSYVAARMRNTEYAETSKVTGVKALL
jgi:hypothetical protein